MIERLRDIGEFEYIRRISCMMKTSSSVVKGIGDDCAVIKYSKDKYLLFTTDMIIEDIHFKIRKTSPEDIGYKALAVTISDIAACGGLPKWAVVSIGASPESRCDFINSVYKGIEWLARRFSIDIVGGDTNSSEKLVISVALVGEVEKDCLALRSGAKDKDIIALTGMLRENPEHLTFVPRLKKSRYLVKNFKVNSMIDISDGFFQDLKHILEENKKSAIIYESLIPCNLSPCDTIKVLNEGEQFELIFTMPAKQAKRLPKGFYPVGEIISGRKGITYVTRNGIRKEITPGGYKHF